MINDFERGLGPEHISTLADGGAPQFEPPGVGARSEEVHGAIELENPEQDADHAQQDADLVQALRQFGVQAGVVQVAAARGGPHLVGRAQGAAP